MKRDLIIGAVVLLALVIGGKAWLDAHDASLKFQATQDANAHVISDLKQQIADRDAALKTQLDSIAQQKAVVKTPQQAAQVLPQIIPNLQPIVIRPDAPSRAVMPVDNLKILSDFGRDCQACAVKLTAAEQDKADKDRQILALQSDIKSAKQAAKGGGFFRRLKSNTKMAVIGSAVAGAVICGTGHCR